MSENIQNRNYNDGSINGFLRSQGDFEAGALKKLTITASGFIKNDKVRYDFVTNVEAFMEAQLECISGNGSQGEKILALDYLQQEQEYLDRQVTWLQSKQVKPAASVEVRIVNGVLSYIVKSIGLIGGVLQIVSGGFLVLAGSPTVVGSAVGVMLILHGATNVWENGRSLFFGDDDATGPATYLYGEAANLLGFDRSYGKLAFAGIDLGLSAVALFGTKLVPDAWRLFRYLPSDYEMGFRTMSTLELYAEIFPDAATLYSGTQTYFSLPESEPEAPPQPLIPFHDY
ncbi:DUF4225 domain-containing protein [Citrobacter portucalensis]|uniref:DUF4225 domain-containing protein n=1 Tax=Citrobacter portucalensis TaxID=1639133 RepID=UPI00158014A7|nr:DUF4225 domain-containing protein [Citrobacter portucalensis]NUH55313.1 DUF4225 domain-containing protein [Citrobacter portucalensis]WNI86971.1 DUF4225 domain-containing protein [Citrobacter portucalensis]